jgi:translin
VVDLSELQDAVLERLQTKHVARERALTAGRQATRHAANAIRAVHRDEHDRADALIGQSRSALAEAEAACRGHPDIEHAGFLADARKEYVEACTTSALVTGGGLPGPEELGVGDAEYLNGLAEAVGELRRRVLDRLRAGEIGSAEQLLAAMDDIYALLTTIDFPDGITGGLRRSTDLARGITERTRGDVTTALLQERLRVALARHREELLGG